MCNFTKLETVFCRRFFYFLSYIFLLFIVPLQIVWAESVSGYISDNNAEPVPFAIIQNKSKNLVTYCDEEGFFNLKGENSVGDTIQINRIGFHQKKIVLNNCETINIVLIPRNIDLLSVFVEGTRSDFDKSPSKTIRIEKTEATKAIDSRKIFSSIPGAYVKSYGGSAGISTLSIDGAPSRHTQILVSGFDITNAQTGQVDLSQLPENFIDNITYSPITKSAFQNLKSEGTVNITPWKDRNSVFYEIGSYGIKKFGLTGHCNTSRININILAGKSENEGNYKGYHPMKDKNVTVENNYIKRDYLSISTSAIINKKLVSRFLYLYSKQNRGVAGQIWSPTLDSYRKDNFHLFGMKLGWAARYGSGLYQATYRKSHDLFFQYISYKHDVSTIRQQISQNIKFAKFLRYAFTLKYNIDFMESSGAGKHDRGSLDLINSISLTKNKFQFTPKHQYCYSKDLYSKHNWSTSLKYNFDRFYISYIQLNYGSYYYFPTFNDLYWTPGGNSNLKPEETTVKSLDFQFSIFSEKDLNFKFYEKNSSNLIQWRPQKSYWRPENISKTIREGIKVIYAFSFEKVPISGFLNYNYNYTEDKKEKWPLLYSPLHSGSINLNYDIKKIKIFYQLTYSDEKVSRQPNVLVNAYTEQTFGCSYKLTFNYGEINTNFLVENFTNEKYETIEGYPEPGRIYKFRFQYAL